MDFLFDVECRGVGHFTNEGRVSVSILIVDDEPEIASLLGEEFADAGYEVTIANGFLDGFALIQSHHFDCMITDIKMPDGSGMELLDAVLKKSGGTTDVVVISGFADVSEQDAIDRGALALLGKPIDIDAMLELLASKKKAG